ncbi:odorant receptor 7a-like isoform X3 [Pieris brassicae]|uniref:odorant receptor 7a-like isoform X3 n=1 Tax=Pieris brassicae TaxID=7116 RepID=UPI001E660988|nr:odorant receptor 7a-like isoform X3 [Pieris brassicae]XP_045528011.1 odorant receptor 7a-like isoform X3 [Pieris brassicae]XP_045528012.1 odorant receptor 7a-like isoform X3 [Pieris brassicae]
MFVQFTVASGSICAILCSLLLPKTFGELMSLLLFMSTYAVVVILEIFIPSYLETQLRYRSQKLVNAAYCSEWIARSESFKRSLKLFMLRANNPIDFSGCGLFPLTLDTFTSPKTFGALMSMLLYMSPYAFVMILQIFVPAYLGTQLRYRSQDLVNAAYCSEWIARSESFKRSLKLFMLRANTPIVFSGCGLFPLTLDTFTSIMKTAYSFFTVVRNVQSAEK